MDNGITADMRDIYNLKLLENENVAGSDIVTNDLDFSDEHCLYVLTGAN